ncbi:MAG: twin-arginine translocase subunit TatC [Gemmatimonadota bacterium]
MRRVRGAAEMPFLEHLEELRRRLIWILLALAVGAVGGVVAVTELNVLGWLQRPIEPYLVEGRLAFTSPTEPIGITFKLGFLLGLIVASPVIAAQLWKFLSPALYASERRVIVPSLVAAMLLFLGGVALGYWVALPLGLRFLLTFQTEALLPWITAGEYLKFATRVVIAFGVIFELPIVILILSALGVVTPAMLRRYRRHAIILLAVVAAILTPADIVSMLVMLVPLTLLYEGSLWVAVLVTRGRERRLADDDAPATSE